MELNKRKFKKDEVELIINQINSKCNSKLSDCYTLISELKEENKKLSFQLAEFKENEQVINNSIKETAKKTSGAKLLIDKKYEAEIISLKDFHNKWKSYFNSVFEKYPLYPAVKSFNKITTEINAVLNDDSIDNKRKIQKIEKTIPQEKQATFNPMKKIESYVAATSDNGFNLEEVLNPGELKLEDLCKELGLIE